MLLADAGAAGRQLSASKARGAIPSFDHDASEPFKPSVNPTIGESIATRLGNTSR